jgi:hypothetical protein
MEQAREPKASVKKEKKKFRISGVLKTIRI